MNADEIIAALEAPVEQRRPVMDALEADAPVEDLVAALRTADQPFTRTLLSGMLGRRATPESLSALVDALADPHPRVRAVAGDAVGLVLRAHPDAPGREAAGRTLVERWAVEPERDVRTTLIAAMGPARHAPAWRVLEAALDDPDDLIR